MSAFGVLVLTGSVLFWRRRHRQRRLAWLWPLHAVIGSVMVGLIMTLLAIGIVGTLGEYGRLGHSWHLVAGCSVVALAIASAWSASQIRAGQRWARPVHISLNGVLGVALLAAGLTGWQVVQKYLP